MLAGGRGVLGVYYLLENIYNWRGHRSIKFLKKPKAIVQGFFIGIRTNVLRKVIHLKVNDKRN